MNAISNAQVNGSGNSQSSRATPAANDVRVDGLEISWPDDGWYEVQSATSYNTISEGGRSATLPHGTYNLINHTTGERFENISVPNVETNSLDFSDQNQSSLGQFRNAPIAADVGSIDADVDNPAVENVDQSQTVDEVDFNNEPILISWPGNWISTDTIGTNTITPEDTWGETLTETAAWWAAGGPFAGLISLGSGIDIETETVQGPTFWPINMLVQGIINIPDLILGNRPSAAVNDNESSNQGEISSADSAEDGGYGTYPVGEFGGTPTTPAPEPISQATSTQPTRDPNRNSDSDTDNGPGGGGISSSQSASDGGWGSSRGGEFG